MAAPDFFIKALIRIAKLQGRGVLEAVVTGQFRVISEGGSKILTSAAMGGKSYSFQIPPSLTTDIIMSKAEEALELFDSTPTDQLDNWLSARPITTTKAVF